MYMCVIYFYKFLMIPMTDDFKPGARATGLLVRIEKNVLLNYYKEINYNYGGNIRIFCVFS